MSKQEIDITIKNEYVTAVVSTRAAEIRSFKSNADQIEMIWQRDPQFWTNCNPTLFPFVNRLNQENRIVFNDREYFMTQHGFARRALFNVEEVKEDEVTLFLTESDDDIFEEKFPFHFRLTVNFKLDGKKIVITHHVLNTETEKQLPFEIGFHPAFNVPMTEDRKYNDYQIIFEKEEDLKSTRKDYGVKKVISFGQMLDDLVGTAEQSFFFHNSQIKSDYVDLTDGVHTIRVGIKGFKTLGFWRKNENTPFVCIEPQFPVNDLPSDNTYHADRANMLLDAGRQFDCQHYYEII